MSEMPHNEIEHQAHTRVRLEAFSDVVFGFSLAQLALALPPPSHVTSLRAIDLFIFVAAFGFISFVWWRHHLIFRDYFVPEAGSIVLNFVLLAAVALVTYAIQAETRGNFSISSVILYASVLGTIYSSMSAMIGRGLRRRDHIASERLHSGKRLSLGFGLLGVVFFGSLLLLPLGSIYVVCAWFLAVFVRVAVRFFG